MQWVQPSNARVLHPSVQVCKASADAHVPAATCHTRKRAARSPSSRQRAPHHPFTSLLLCHLLSCLFGLVCLLFHFLLKVICGDLMCVRILPPDASIQCTRIRAPQQCWHKDGASFLVDFAKRNSCGCSGCHQQAAVCKCQIWPLGNEEQGLPRKVEQKLRAVNLERHLLQCTRASA